jgi:hypothetical protein
MTASVWPRTRLCVLAAHFARALLGLFSLLPPSRPRGRREGRVLTSHPRSAARKCSAKRPHSSIQVVPITRPSLRSGLTAYAVISREPSSFWPPSLRELTMWLTRLGAPHLRESLAVATTARTTRFCRTHGSLVRRIIPRPCRNCRENAGETNLTAPLVGTRFRARRDYPPCPHLSHPTLPASTASPARNQDDTRSPLKDEPGWATHTPFPNFGKVEYFYGMGLTG